MLHWASVPNTRPDRKITLQPAVIAGFLILIASVNLAWAAAAFMRPDHWMGAEIVRMFGVGNGVLAVMAATAAVLVFRPTVAASAMVRATAIGSVLYCVPQMSLSHLFNAHVGLLARMQQSPVNFHPVDVEAATVVLAVLVLALMGRRGSGGEGTAFAPHRFRRALLFALTGMASLAALMTIYFGLRLYASGGEGWYGVWAPVVLGLIAHGMLRLRTWSIPAAVALGIASAVSGLVTDAPGHLVVIGTVTPLVLLPLLVALTRAAWPRLRAT